MRPACDQTVSRGPADGDGSGREDMNSKYEETSEAGLAQSVVLC